MKMRVLLSKPSDKERAIFQKDSNMIKTKLLEPFILGQGSFSYECGLCGLTLIKSIDQGQVRNIVFKCPKCGAYNE